jgi:hypothetical protein
VGKIKVENKCPNNHEMVKNRTRSLYPPSLNPVPHIGHDCGAINTNIFSESYVLFFFSEERCLACNPVETYENILDNFCRADFGE